MRWLPFDKKTLVTSLSAAEVGKRLAENTARPKFSMFGARPTTPFLGQVGQGSFSIMRNINYRNSFLPVLRGRIVPSGGTTRIELRLRLRTPVLVFYVIWMSFAVGVATVITVVGIMNWNGIHDFKPPMLIPYVLVVFGYALGAGGFAMERGKSLEALKQLVGAVELEGDH
jgi:hypothetical protein